MRTDWFVVRVYAAAFVFTVLFWWAVVEGARRLVSLL